ncbi:hypothetical protein [Chloracidobacterium aggregatum]|uniref:hypothetical protein n=1 Tax=Chloracidobacterium aggregatum TaxID=2851959 RepID=UPI001B8D655A|nr:hypothetical protein [Chloracidobacterium aggregatum]QUV91996.1 hypothetical protein J8C04_00020 [Chloracidobacterium sp. A]
MFGAFSTATRRAASSPDAPGTRPPRPDARHIIVQDIEQQFDARTSCNRPNASRRCSASLHPGQQRLAEKVKGPQVAELSKLNCSVTRAVGVNVGAASRAASASGVMPSFSRACSRMQPCLPGHQAAPPHHLPVKGFKCVQVGHSAAAGSSAFSRSMTPPRFLLPGSLPRCYEDVTHLGIQSGRTFRVSAMASAHRMPPRPALAPAGLGASERRTSAGWLWRACPPFRPVAEKLQPGWRIETVKGFDDAPPAA